MCQIALGWLPVWLSVRFPVWLPVRFSVWLPV